LFAQPELLKHQKIELVLVNFNQDQHQFQTPISARKHLELDFPMILQK
jgi:hypothetical protein